MPPKLFEKFFGPPLSLSLRDAPPGSLRCSPLRQAAAVTWRGSPIPLLQDERQPSNGKPARARNAFTSNARWRSTSTVAVASSSTPPPPSSRRAFLPCSVKIIHVSKPCPLHDALTQEWLDKARRYATKVEEIRLPVNPQKAKDNDAAMKAEGERVMKAISASDFVVLLDERGKNLTSEQLADLVAEAGERCSSSSSLAFVVGGPFGHAGAVSDRADATLGLSRLVLNHAVARVVLSEALYRAYTILKGVPYHH